MDENTSRDLPGEECHTRGDDQVEAVLADEFAEVGIDEEPPLPNRPWLNRLPFLITGALGVYILLVSISLGIGTTMSPKPGMWPMMLSVLLIICSIFGIFVANGEDTEAFGSRLIRPLLGAMVLALFPLLFPLVGLILTGAIVLFLWFKFLAGETWKTSIILSVCAAFAAYLIFSVLLGAVFPPDVIAQLWGGR